MGISIRRLTIQDEPVLWDFIYLALFVPSGQPPLPRDIVWHPEISRYVHGWGELGDEGFVAHDHDLAVGAAWIRLLSGPNKGFGYVNEDTPELSMAVIPDYRGQGIGSRLLTLLLDQAVSRFGAIGLSVAAENPAKRLYDRFGFAVVKASGSSITMMRKLTP